MELVQNPEVILKANKSREKLQQERLKLKTTTSGDQDKQELAILKQEWQAGTALETLNRAESKCKIPKILWRVV